MDKPVLLLGAPGTGKTHRLIQEILDRRTHSFAFLSFTKRAANEAKRRLAGYFSTEQLKYVRTIHSFCFELAGLRKEQIMNTTQVYQFAQECGFDLHLSRQSLEDGSVHYFMSDDDIAYRQLQIDIAKLDIPNVRENPLYKPYIKYMKDNGLIDYSQMVALGTEAISKRLDVPKFDLLLVDEFQDLTPIQLAFIGQLRKCCKETILAADDNQMIFEWAGVDRTKFIGLATDSDIQYLDKNWRLSPAINDLSQKVAARQTHTLTPPSSIGQLSGDYGAIEFVAEDMINFEEDKQYLVLARNNYWLEELTDGLDLTDQNWSWLDEEKDTPIRVSTIHGAKGAEADNVVLYTDVSPATYEQIDSDAEHRVWYVGITRARKKLFIIQPQSSCFYDLE